MQVGEVDREKLLLLENPRYVEVIVKIHHLGGVEMLDKDQKPELPVHLVIGTNEYTQIKTKSPPKIGHQGEPIAEMYSVYRIPRLVTKARFTKNFENNYAKVQTIGMKRAFYGKEIIHL